MRTEIDKKKQSCTLLGWKEKIKNKKRNDRRRQSNYHTLSSATPYGREHDSASKQMMKG